MKNNNIIKIIGAFFVVIALFTSVFWNDVSGQLAQVTSLSISPKPIFSDIIDVKDINTLNSFISRVSFVNNTIRDNFIMETREAVSSGGGVTLYFYPSMTANTIAVHNTNKYSQKYLSKHIVIRGCCGKYEDRILTFSVSNSNYSFAPDKTGTQTSASVSAKASGSGSNTSVSNSGSGSSNGSAASVVTAPKRYITPNLDANMGICRLLSAAYSLTDRLGVTPSGDYPNKRYQSPNDPNSKFWNHFWLERFAGEIKGNPSSYVYEEGMLNLYKNVLKKSNVTNTKYPIGGTDNSTWNSISSKLNSKKIDCMFMTSLHASYVENITVRADGKRVVTIINTLEQGINNKRNQGGDVSEHLYPPYRPSQTTFVIDKDGKIESVTTTKLNSQVSDEEIEITRKWWERRVADENKRGVIWTVDCISF